MIVVQCSVCDKHVIPEESKNWGYQCPTCGHILNFEQISNPDDLELGGVFFEFKE